MNVKKNGNEPRRQGKTLVMKFGGTSVGSSAAIRQAADIVQEQHIQWKNMVVVVSAMSGVTDSLIACARESVTGSELTSQQMVANLQQRHTLVLNDLIPEESGRAMVRKEIEELFAVLRSLCEGIHIMGELTPRGLDAVVSLGERINARLFSAVLKQKGLASQALDASDLIVTDDAFQHARPLMEETRAKTRVIMQPLLKQNIVVVVTGFIGATRDGVITTLGRGGSDYTAAILGDCLDADQVWTWTDVDGVMTADPRIVPEARVIPTVSYNEVSEMAYFGAKVLHPKTIRPVIERDIPLWVKNTFHPSYPGTCITGDAPSHDGHITAVTAIRGLSLITVEGRGMIGVPGIAARTFSAVARHDASVLMISQASSEQSICFIIPSEAQTKVVRAIEEEMERELARHDVDRVWAQPDVVIVTAIGSGMRNTPGVSARLFGALGKENINVIAIAQGSSEYSISVVVDACDADQAVQKIHQEVIINGFSK